MPFATIWMDLEMIILSEVSQRKINILWYHLHVESNKNSMNGLIYKTEIEILKANLWLLKGILGWVGAESDKLGDWD